MALAAFAFPQERTARSEPTVTTKPKLTISKPLILSVCQLDIHYEYDKRFAHHYPLGWWRGCRGRWSVGSHSGRELPGLCPGLLGWCPVSARLLAKRVDRGVESGEEVIWIEGADQFVALELRSDRVLEFGEHEGGALSVEFLVEIGEHVGGGGVDVGHRFCGDEDPLWSWLYGCEATDLVAEGAGVSEEQGCVEPEDHKAE